MFDDHLRAFIDDELPVNVRSLFIDHAEECARCAKKLRDMETVCAQLAGLSRVAVSPEFDFSMKLRIRRERVNLQKPWYPLLAAIREQYARLILLPAAAVLLAAGFTFYQNLPSGPMHMGLPQEVVQQLQRGVSVDLASDVEGEQVDEINYVLEKASPGEIEQGIMLTGRSRMKNRVSQQDIMLISF